ncbi:hypothetical protein [Roseomonas mucosa]|uniref:hypothetical protein n=1 Tax=Roseomonas mucosa TaxID=207340 RepID=UPI00384DDA77
MSTMRGRKLEEFLTRNARAKEGPLFRWLWENHAAVEAGLTRHKTGWKVWIARLESEGIRGKFGGHPSSSRVVRIWKRVCQEKRRLREEAPATGKPTGEKLRRQSPKKAVTPIAAASGTLPPTDSAPPFASAHVTKEAPRRSFAEVPDSALPLPKVPTCVIPPNETPEERIARNQRLLDEQFRRTDAWLGMPVTRKKP